MGFLGRWLSHSLTLVVSLLLGVLAMQAPAFTREYAAALLQVSADARRDIDQREASARQFYGITAATDDDLLQALKPFEPSNAETLARTLDRAQTLRAAHDAIIDHTPLLQPIIALGDAAHDPEGYKRPIWQLVFDTYAIQLDFSAATIVYGVAGVMLGSLLAQLAFAPFRRRDRRAIGKV